MRYAKDFGATKNFDALIENMILLSEDENLLKCYKDRIEQNRIWNENRKIENFHIGMKLDISSPEYIWCVGIVKRIFFRGEKQKYIAVSYDKFPNIYNEEIGENSNRLAKFGFFSKREDIPKLVYNENGEKNILLFDKKLDFDFVGKFSENTYKKLVETDSSYISESDEE